MKKLDIASVAEFIRTQTPETRIYLGCDSERIKIDGVWYADYVLAIVVHINGNNGCKLFGEVQRERVWDAKPGKPAMRLMTEVYKVSELYLKLADVLEGRKLKFTWTSTQRTVRIKLCDLTSCGLYQRNMQRDSVCEARSICGIIRGR